MLYTILQFIINKYYLIGAPIIVTKPLSNKSEIEVFDAWPHNCFISANKFASVTYPNKLEHQLNVHK